MTLAAFGVVAVLMELGITAGLDSYAHRVGLELQSGILGRVAPAVTFLGSAWGLVPVALVATLLRISYKQYGLALLPAIALVLAWIGNPALKCLFLRPRPTPGPWVERFTGCDQYAFPSGHSMNSMALYGLLILWLLASPRQPGRVATALLLSLVFLAIGLSRVVLGMHWLTDVVAGWLAGLALASLVILFGQHLAR